MVMSCQAWPPWLVPSPLNLAFEVAFQRLAKEVGLWTGRMWGELGHNLQAPGVSASAPPSWQWGWFLGNRATYYLFMP